MVDAYEVMITGRLYKEAVSKKEVMAELEHCSGTQFDPQLVEKFIEILKGNGGYKFDTVSTLSPL